MVEKRAERPYNWEEVFSFDRLKRAITARALDQIEGLWEGGRAHKPRTD